MIAVDIQQDALRLAEYLDRSVTPYHAADEAAGQYAAAGFAELLETDAWQLSPGGAYFLKRGGSIVAFRVGYQEPWLSGVRIAAAHTDSPALKLKLAGEKSSQGLLTMPVEVYGGAIVSTWLDRNLGIAGQVSISAGGKTTQRLFRTDRPIATIPNVAIHLNRTVNEGFEYNKQTHLPVVLDARAGEVAGGQLVHFVADALGVLPEEILDADLFLFDGEPARSIGMGGTLLTSGRIDNLAAASAVVEALCSASQSPGTSIAILFNHEEVGSKTYEGAESGLLRSVIERIVLSTGGGREELHRTLAGSFLISNDAAHAVHPSYTDKYDPSYSPQLNGGPVVKYNGNFRYTTTAETSAWFQQLCRSEGVPVQFFNNRSDMQAGSTIGPTASAGAEIKAVDVGIPILAMHSVREVCGIIDCSSMKRVLVRFFGVREVDT